MKNTVKPNPATETYVPPDPDPKRQRVLELLVLGNSVSAAMNAVDMHRRSFYYSCKSDPAYAALANRARNIHIADIDDALHEVDADARALVHRIIVDENLTASVRLRAAITALNRKGPGWLPRELPPYEHGPQQCQTGEQSNATRAEARPSGWAHNVPSRNYSTTPNEIATDHECGEQSDAARSPQGASNDSPGRKARKRQPSEARPPQPPAASSKSGAKVTLITKSENARTVQTVQSTNEIQITRHLTANQSLPVTNAAIEPTSEIAETVQTVRAIDRIEPTASESDLAARAINSELSPCTPQTEPWSSGQGPGSRSRINEKPLLQGEQSDAARSPQGASNDSPGRKARKRQPSEARPPQPPAASSTPGATVTLITKAKCRRDNARTVQTVQSPNATENTRHLTANQSLPVTKATIEPPSEIAETVQTVQSIGHTEPGSPDSELPRSKPKTEPWSSGQGPGSRSPTNETPLLQGEQGDATAKSPQGVSNDSPGRKAGENQPSEARPPQPRLSQDTPGAKVAARIVPLIATQSAANNNASSDAMPVDYAIGSSPVSGITPTKCDPASASSAAPRENSPKAHPKTANPNGDVTMRIDAAFLSKYTVLRHESPEDFAHLLREMTAIYEPQSKPEELQVLRIAQAHWNLRRIETMQTAVLDSTVEQIRCKLPDAHPAAAIATTFLGKQSSDQVWFLDRMHHYRKFHEDHLSRQEGLLFRYKEAREVSAVRATRQRSIVGEGKARTLSQPDRRCILHHNLETAFQATLVAETTSLTEALGRPQ